MLTCECLLNEDYSLGIRGSSNTSGSVELTFLNISGRICADDWDNNDATVACRELGHSMGEYAQYCMNVMISPLSIYPSVGRVYTIYI